MVDDDGVVGEARRGVQGGCGGRVLGIVKHGRAPIDAQVLLVLDGHVGVGGVANGWRRIFLDICQRML